MPTLRGKLLKWGNSYGVRISKKDVEIHHLRPGDELDVEVPKSRPLTWDDMPVFDMGPDASQRHDELFGQAMAEEYAEQQKSAAQIAQQKAAERRVAPPKAGGRTAASGKAVQRKGGHRAARRRTRP